MERDTCVTVLDTGRLTDQDLLIMQTMAEITPSTRFAAGDLCLLLPAGLQHIIRARKLAGEPLPSAVPWMWQVRFVVSRGAFDLWNTALALAQETDGGPVSFDWAMDRMDIGLVQRLLHPTPFREVGREVQRLRRPYIYAHGFPHGTCPDSTQFFGERHLKRLPYRDLTIGRDPSQPWEIILDEAGAPFHGYDSQLMAWALSLAPDLYCNGSNIGRPFSFEEQMVHTMALLGLEQEMFVKAQPSSYLKRAARIAEITEQFQEF